MSISAVLMLFLFYVLGLSQIKDSGLFCGFIRDLTSEKAAQAEIIESHERMTKIVDASFDALFYINEKGIILQVNSATSNLFGWTEEEFLGGNISMIMPEGHASRHESYMEVSQVPVFYAPIALYSFEPHLNHSWLTHLTSL